jgi:hypothetical protein
MTSEHACLVNAYFPGYCTMFTVCIDILKKCSLHLVQTASYSLLCYPESIDSTMSTDPKFSCDRRNLIHFKFYIVPMTSIYICNIKSVNTINIKDGPNVKTQNF